LPPACQRIRPLHIGFSGVSGWSCVLYLAAAFLILTQPVDRFTFPIILAVAIACRLAVLFAEPYLSSDISRYVWDGIVQHAHINPYRYVPGDPVLAFLRAPNQDIFDNINRRDYAHTIYPPAAQRSSTSSPRSRTVTFMQTVMVLFEGVTMYALITLLRYLGIAPRADPSLPPGAPHHLGDRRFCHSTPPPWPHCPRAPRPLSQAADSHWPLPAIAILLKFYPLVLFPALLPP